MKKIKSDSKTINDSIIFAYICLFCIYISFETIWLNYVPENFTSIIRYGFEFIGYILLFILIFIRRILKLTKFDRELLLFIIYCLFNIIINKVEPLIAFAGLRWIIRYFYIYFLIRFSSWNQTETVKIYKLIELIMLIEIILSILQLSFPDFAQNFLRPKYNDVIEGISSYSLQGESKYAIYASFGRYNEFGYFCLISAWYWISELVSNRNKKSKSVFMLIIWIILCILSYARQNVAALMISAVLFYLLYNKGKYTTSQIIIIIIILNIFLAFILIIFPNLALGLGTINTNILERFFSIFTTDFITFDFNNKGRTWFLTVAIYRLLSKSPFFGFGVGMFGSQSALSYNDIIYKELNIPTMYSMDTYIAPIIGQLGIVGLILLANIYIFIIKITSKVFHNVDKPYNQFTLKNSILTFGVCLSGLILTFFSSSLSDRYFAFYLWLFISMQVKNFMK